MHEERLRIIIPCEAKLFYLMDIQFMVRLPSVGWFVSISVVSGLAYLLMEHGMVCSGNLFLSVDWLKINPAWILIENDTAWKPVLLHIHFCLHRVTGIGFLLDNVHACSSKYMQIFSTVGHAWMVGWNSSKLDTPSESYRGWNKHVPMFVTISCVWGSFFPYFCCSHGGVTGTLNMRCLGGIWSVTNT